MNGRKPTPCTTPLIFTQYAAGIALLSDDTAASLPSDLNHSTVFDEQWHGEGRLCKEVHALAGLAIGFDIVFGEIFSFPFKPLAHFARVRAACRSKELQVRHDRSPPARRERGDKSTPELPGCGECSLTGRSRGNPRGRDEGLRLRHIRAAPPSTDFFCGPLPVPSRYFSIRH